MQTHLLHKHKAINGDDLFRWIYHYMKNSDFFDLFRIIGIKNQEKREIFFEQKYKSFNIKKESDKYLSFKKKIHNQIKEYVNKKDTK